jgi:hypothetical protein
MAQNAGFQGYICASPVQGRVFYVGWDLYVYVVVFNRDPC